MKHIVDFSKMECAFGVNTSYYAGLVVVDGGEIVVDGLTDRSLDGPVERAVRACMKKEGVQFEEDLTEKEESRWDLLEEQIRDLESGDVRRGEVG